MDVYATGTVDAQVRQADGRYAHLFDASGAPGLASGTAFWVDGRAYATGLLSGRDGDQAGSLGEGALSTDSATNTATVTWSRDGLVFSLTVGPHTGSLYSFDQTWTVANQTGRPVADVKVITGGAIDSAAAPDGYVGWDAARDAIYWWSHADRGAEGALSGVRAVGSASSAHLAGPAAQTLATATAGALTDQVITYRGRHGAYLQWDIGWLADGAAASVQGRLSSWVLISPDPHEVTEPFDPNRHENSAVGVIGLDVRPTPRAGEEYYEYEEDAPSQPPTAGPTGGTSPSPSPSNQPGGPSPSGRGGGGLPWTGGTSGWMALIALAAIGLGALLHARSRRHQTGTDPRPRSAAEPV
jgi:hypothetical protein